MKTFFRLVVFFLSLALIFTGCLDPVNINRSQGQEQERLCSCEVCEDCQCPYDGFCMSGGERPMYQCECGDYCEYCECENDGDCQTCCGEGCTCGEDCDCDTPGDCLKCGGNGDDCECGPRCTCDVCECANPGDCIKCGGGDDCTCGPNCDCTDDDCTKCGGGDCTCGPNCDCTDENCQKCGGGDCTCGPNCDCTDENCQKCGDGDCTCGPTCDCTDDNCLECDNCKCIDCGDCGKDCSNGCTCIPPGDECTCDNCNCIDCNCTSSECKCPPIIDPPTGLYGFGVSRNTLIDTGLALRDGEVWVWGFRGSGQQGNGNSVVLNTAAPAKVNSLSNIVTVTGSAYTLVALDKDGNAWGWGQNLYGAAGVGVDTGIISTPRQITFPGNAKVDQIAAGEYFFIARGTDGSVYTWGHNLYGQLGVNTTANLPRSSPQKVNLSGETASLVGAAYEGAFVVTDQGNVWAWGDNEASGLGFAGSNYGVQQIRRTPVKVNSLQPFASQITYIAGGNGWGQALLEDGRVIGWGLRASLGQGTTSVSGVAGHTNGNVITVTSNIAQMHSRYVGTIALTRDNKVLTWGQTGGSAFPTIYGPSVTDRTVQASGTIIDIGGGKEHVYYRTQDGRVWGAGYGAARKLLFTSAINQSWPGVVVNLP